MNIHEVITQLKAPIVILSLGPYSSHFDQQQYLPNFSIEIADNFGFSVDILNIDMGFSETLASKPQPLFDSGFQDLSVEFSVSCYKHFLGEDVAGFLGGVTELLDRDQFVIIVHHLSPTIPEWLLAYLINNQDKLGNSLEIIGSYFTDIPVVLYRQSLFDGNSPDEINTMLTKQWSKWTMAFDEGLGVEQQYNTMTTSELEDLRNQVSHLGILYRNLASISAWDLFNPDAEPQPIIGLSEDEKAAYLKQLTQSLDPSAPLVDAADKGLTSVVNNLLTSQEIDQRNQYGRTALMQACSKGHLEIIHLLLDAGADPTLSARSPNETPINFAAWGKHLEVIKVLVNKDKTLIEGSKSDDIIEYAYNDLAIREYIEQVRSRSKQRPKF